MKIIDFKLERFFAKYEFSTPHMLCCSACESLSVAELLALEPGAADALNSLRLGYTESLGHPELRREIALLYNNISPDDVIVFSGAEEGIFALVNALVEPGEHLIAPFPAYQSLLEVARAAGCEVSRWTLDEGNRWEPDLDLLEDLLRPQTRMIIVNFPHNPTGALPSRESFEKIIEIARERGIVLFSDEVYRFSEYSPADRLPGACDLYEKAVSLGVMSKSFGLAGLRIGWLATRDKQIFERCAAFKDYTTICNSAPSELLATVALRHKQAILERNLGIIRSNLELLDDFFAEHSALFEWVRPKAGAVAFPRLKSGSAEAFCLELKNDAGVLLLPSTVFDYGDSHFRIGFGRANMPKVLAEFSAQLTR
jgi:aspartate/methionine/tyrosine aminotransferase